MEGEDVEYLVKNNFTKLPLQQQLKIKSDGRPTPKLELRTERKNGVHRTFNQDNYVRTEWLTASAKLQRLFCWPCLLFDKDSCYLNNPWVTAGFADLANLSRGIERHGKSKSHIDCAVKLKLFGRVRNGQSLHLERSISTKKLNEHVKRNRDILMRLVVAAVYLARQQQAFRGHSGTPGSANRGNFVELVHAFSEFDATLAEHLDSSPVFSGMSSTVQDDITESIAHVIQNETDKEIHTSPFIAVQVDDTSDISNRCHLSVVIRYVDEKGNVCERFLGFFDISSDRDAETITSVVMRAIENYSPTQKLVCQTYDGSSCRSDVPASVRARCPHALFIHCCAHKLNLVLAQGTSSIPAAKLFFAGVDAFYKFFSRSRKSLALLCEVDRAVGGPGGSAVRWDFNNRGVHAIHDGRTTLCIIFDKIMTESGWDTETIAESSALKQKLEDFNFTFLIGVFHSIFGLTEPLCQVLQGNMLDIKKCLDHIKSTIGALKATGTDETFTDIYDKTVQTVGEPVPQVKRRRHGPENVEQGVNPHQEGATVAFFRCLYFQIVDAIVLHMVQRFADMEHLSFFRVLEHTSFATFCKPTAFPSSELAQLVKIYPFFDEQKLRNELHTLYNNRLLHKPAGELLQFLIKDDLQGTLSEIYKLLQLMLTIPTASASGEHSLSCLKRIKTYLRNTRGQDRLVSLAKISVNSVVVEDLKDRGNFYDMVINHFATMRDGRTALFFG